MKCTYMELSSSFFGWGPLALKGGIVDLNILNTGIIISCCRVVLGAEDVLLGMQGPGTTTEDSLPWPPGVNCCQNTFYPS